MRTLENLIRTAAVSSDPGSDAQKVLNTIEGYADDPEELNEFLISLASFNEDRALSYLNTMKRSYPELWDAVQAMATPEDSDEEDEEVVEAKPFKGKRTKPRTGEDEEEEDTDEEGTDEEGTEEEGKAKKGKTCKACGKSLGKCACGGSKAKKGKARKAEALVADPASLGETTAFDMVLVGASSAEPHFIILADGEPLARLALADQPNREDIKEFYGERAQDYVPHIVEALTDSLTNSIGVEETLGSIHAVPYMAVANASVMAEQLRVEAQAAAEEDLAERLGNVKEDMLNHIHLAVMASNKGSRGLFVENKLKQAMVSAMDKQGVEGANQLISKIWAREAGNYFGDILTYANKLMGMTPEAVAEVTREIVGASADAGDDETETLRTPIRQASGHKPSADNNVPLRTTTVSSDYRADTKQKISSSLSHRATSIGRRR